LLRFDDVDDDVGWAWSVNNNNNTNNQSAFHNPQPPAIENLGGLDKSGEREILFQLIKRQILLLLANGVICLILLVAGM